MKILFDILAGIYFRVLPFVRIETKDHRFLNGMILGSNLIPILGVLFFNWSAFSILIIYWFESLAIGLFNVPRILMAGMYTKENTFTVLGLIAALFFASFFTVHYGLFMGGHLVFLLGMGQYLHALNLNFTGEPAAMVLGMAGKLEGYLRATMENPVRFLMSELLSVVLLFGVAASNFFTTYVREREYLVKMPPEVMMEPYRRIIIMHVTIILGMFSVLLLDRQEGIMVVFILLKTGFDIYQINRGNKKKEENRLKTE